MTCSKSATTIARLLLNNIEELLMPIVRVKEGENPDYALRRFKRACEKAGVLTDARRREFYEKPTAERKRKKAAAVKRHQKKVSREMMASTRRKKDRRRRK